MQQTLLTIPIIFYGTTGILAFVAYLPKLKDLWHGTSNANGHSYVLWTDSNAIGVPYGRIAPKNVNSRLAQRLPTTT